MTNGSHSSSRLIVLDTETTGLDPQAGHRVIEIGCVELIDRRLTRQVFHHYLHPEREIDRAAVEVHGLTDEFLRDKPRFAEVAEALIAYLRGAELIIHNAAFDVGFLDHELALWRPDAPRIRALCTVTDTLEMARQRHPGQRNNLDALCKRYHIDHSRRTRHGALLDAEILAEVYLAMTGGQTSLALGGGASGGSERPGLEFQTASRRPAHRLPLPVIRATPAELAEHEQRLGEIDKACGGRCLWHRSESLRDPESGDLKGPNAD